MPPSSTPVRTSRSLLESDMVVIPLKRKPRPLRKTYNSSQPFVVEKHDNEDGSINYEIWDYRPEEYHRLCTIEEEPVDDDIDHEDRGQAKRDADTICAALNMYHNLGKC